MIQRPILLVEDNPDDIELTRRAFRKANVSNELVVRTDGVQALEYLFGVDESGQAPPLPAFVLLDLKLPKLNGLEVLTRIRGSERTRALPVIVLTSSREESDLMASYLCNVNSYICKPVDFTQFSQAVQHVGIYWLVLNEQPKTLQKL